MHCITMGCAKEILLLLCTLSVLSSSTAQSIVVKGDSFSMRCYDGNSAIEYIQVTFKSTGTSEEKQIARYKPSEKTPSIADESYTSRLSFEPQYSFTLKNVNIGDNGMYTCTQYGFALDGNPSESQTLEVQVPPTISVRRLNSPLHEGTDFISAAECIASDAVPAAKVYWDSNRLEFKQTNETTAGNERSTFTSKATLNVSPSRFYNNQPFSCFIDHPALPQKVNVSTIKLDVEYAPSTPLIRVVSDNTILNCSSDGNPVPTITWTMPNGNTAPVPAEGSSVVRIISPTSKERQNDTYICHAENGINPESSAQITTAEAAEYKEIIKTSNTGLIVGVVIGTILIILIIAVLVYWFFIRKQREKDSGPYKPNKKIVRSTEDDEGGWSRSSGRPMIQHANESLNKNAPPSPNQPPPADDDEDEGSNYSHSDVEEFTEGHDVEINSPQTGDDDDDGNMPTAGIVSKNSVNFQHRRKRPSTSPHRRSQNRGQPQPIPRTPQQSEHHYEVPPKENYYDDDYNQEDHHLMDKSRHDEDPMDDRFYDRPEDRYPGYQPRYDEPPHDEHLPPYSDTVQYASIDHGYNSGKPRTRPPYQEPVEYAEIRSKGQIV